MKGKMREENGLKDMCHSFLLDFRVSCPKSAELTINNIISTIYFWNPSVVLSVTFIFLILFGFSPSHPYTGLFALYFNLVD